MFDTKNHSGSRAYTARAAADALSFVSFDDGVISCTLPPSTGDDHQDECLGNAFAAEMMTWIYEDRSRRDFISHISIAQIVSSDVASSACNANDLGLSPIAWGFLTGLEINLA